MRIRAEKDHSGWSGLVTSGVAGVTRQWTEVLPITSPSAPARRLTRRSHADLNVLPFAHQPLRPHVERCRLVRITLHGDRSSRGECIDGHAEAFEAGR